MTANKDKIDIHEACNPSGSCSQECEVTGSFNVQEAYRCILASEEIRKEGTSKSSKESHACSSEETL